MKKILNKFILVSVLSLSTFFVFGQRVSGSQIKGSLKTNGTPGQIDVYFQPDFTNTAANFSGIVLCFSLPTSLVTAQTKVTMLNTQIASMTTATFSPIAAVTGTGAFAGQTFYSFNAVTTATTTNSFTSSTGSPVEFKIGTFQFNDATMNLTNVKLIDNYNGLQGGWVQFYVELSGTEYEPFAPNKFYAGTDGTLGGSGTGSTSTYYVQTVDQIVLPVNLLSFTAAKVGTSINLNWMVASEINAKGYDVERSSGNGANFTAIGSVAANNNGKYSSIDISPLGGVNYYRLKMIDMDGKFKYSEVRTVLFDGTAVLFDIYPNPIVTNKLYLHVQQYNFTGKAQAIITDIAGRSIQTNTINLVKGDNQIPVTVKGLNKGTYFVTIYDVNGKTITETKKLVK